MKLSSNMNFLIKKYKKPEFQTASSPSFKATKLRWTAFSITPM